MECGAWRSWRAGLESLEASVKLWTSRSSHFELLGAFGGDSSVLGAHAANLKEFGAFQHHLWL